MSNVLSSLVEELNLAFKDNKEFIMPVKGTSMLPYIKDGEKVTLIPPKDLRKNDIVFYQRKDGHYVLHRIYKIKSGAYVLLGDHQTVKEYPIYQDQVIAKVKNVITEKKVKEQKGFKYNAYVFFFRSMFIRKVYFKLFIKNR